MLLDVNKTCAMLSNNFMEIIAEVNQLRDSLQKEFEFLTTNCDLSNSYQVKTIAAKKRQQDFAENLKKINSNSFELLEVLIEKIFQLEGCCFVYGITFQEIQMFMSRDKKAIENEIQLSLFENYFVMPEKYRAYIDLEKFQKRIDNYFEEEKKPIQENKKIAQFADKPVLPWQSLLKMAGKYFKKVKMKKSFVLSGKKKTTVVVSCDSTGEVENIRFNPSVVSLTKDQLIEFSDKLTETIGLMAQDAGAGDAGSGDAGAGSGDAGAGSGVEGAGDAGAREGKQE